MRSILFHTRELYDRIIQTPTPGMVPFSLSGSPIFVRAQMARTIEGSRGSTIIQTSPEQDASCIKILI